MDGTGCGEKYRYQPESSIECRRDGSKNSGGRKGAGVQVLVHQIQRSTGNWKSEECRHGRDCGPPGRPLGKTMAGDPPASPQNQENNQDVPGQDDHRQRQMAQPDCARDQLVENGRLQLQSEEVRVVRIERGIQIMLDGGEVDSVVFSAGVIAVDQEGE